MIRRIHKSQPRMGEMEKSMQETNMIRYWFDIHKIQFDIELVILEKIPI